MCLGLALKLFSTFLEVLKKNKMECISTIKVDANYLTVYDSFIDGTPRVNDTSSINFHDNFHDCKMSSSAVKTIKKSANVICYLARKQHFAEVRIKVGCTSYRNQEVLKEAVKNAKNSHLCTFVTLTLPAAQKHTDVEITTYLINPFLVYARKYFNLKYYVWKKELQENGNLHFHLVFDRFIDYKSLRREWNKLLNRGYVKGVEAPFNYVSEYREKWLKMYENGFDKAKMFNYIKNLKSTSDKINDYITKAGLSLDSISVMDYDNICNTIISKELSAYQVRYENEMKKPENERFTDPNSTDINAVKSPALVSFYLAKYIAKDITDMPELKEYTQITENIKIEIYAILKDIQDKKAKNKAYNEELERLANAKQRLKEYREGNCPIKGLLWFKSKSLTPFLTGTKDYLYYDLGVELSDLTKYLLELQKKRNEKRLQEGKEPCRLICKIYGKDEKGKDDINNVICTTLLISCFELQNVRTKDGKRRFPLLCKMWSKFVNDCIIENYEKKVY